MKSGRIGSTIQQRIKDAIGTNETDGINITGNVKAYLTDEDGNRTLVAQAHNKWNSWTGLYNIRLALKSGCSTSPSNAPLLVHSMNVGDYYDTDTWSNPPEGGKRADTVNTTGISWIKYAASWGASGSISNIKQAGIQQYEYDGGGSKVTSPTSTNLCSIVALSSGGFTKADGVELDIEWTTTLTS